MRHMQCHRQAGGLLEDLHCQEVLCLHSVQVFHLGRVAPGNLVRHLGPTGKSTQITGKTCG